MMTLIKKAFGADLINARFYFQLIHSYGQNINDDVYSDLEFYIFPQLRCREGLT